MTDSFTELPSFLNKKFITSRQIEEIKQVEQYFQVQVSLTSKTFQYYFPAKKAQRNQQQKKFKLQFKKKCIVIFEELTETVISFFVSSNQLRYQLKQNVELYRKQEIQQSYKLAFYKKTNAKERVQFLVNNNQVNQLNGLLREIGKNSQMIRIGIKNDYEVVRNLGSGSSGQVYMCQCIRTKERVAVKRIAKVQSKITPQIIEYSFLKEVNILKKINHPSFPEFYQVYESDNAYYIVMELLNKNLFDHLSTQAKIQKDTIINMMKELLQELVYLDEKDIMHRDIKLENILLRKKDDGSLHPVLIDFGLAQFSKNKKYLYPKCGTPGYVAPQIISCYNQKFTTYSTKCDIYSLGVVMHWLLTRQPLFKGRSVKQVMEKQKRNQMDIYFNQITQSSEFLDLFYKMTTPNTNDRITAKQALKHPFLQISASATSMPIGSCLNQYSSINV